MRATRSRRQTIATCCHCCCSCCRSCSYCCTTAVAAAADVLRKLLWKIALENPLGGSGNN